MYDGTNLHAIRGATLKKFSSTVAGHHASHIYFGVFVTKVVEPGLIFMASSTATSTSQPYTLLKSFTDLGVPDVLLQLDDGSLLPAHSEIIISFSSVLRSVLRSTNDNQVRRYGFGFMGGACTHDVDAAAVCPAKTKSLD